MLLLRADAKVKGRKFRPLTYIIIVIVTTVIAYHLFGLFWVFFVWILDVIAISLIESVLYKIRLGRMYKKLLKEYV